MIIRYSPSGPPITNAEGGTAEVGTGFMVRLDEGCTSVDYFVMDPATTYEVKYDPTTALAPFLRPSLDAPSPNRRYRATGAIDMFNNDAATAVITCALWVSYDEASTWHQASFAESRIEPGDRKHCRVDLPLTLGSDLATPMPDGTDSLTLKMTVYSSIQNTQISAPDGDGGTGFLQLTEHL